MFHFCPVCGVKVNRNKAYARKTFNSVEYFLCCPLCQKEFERAPEKYVQNQKK